MLKSLQIEFDPVEQSAADDAVEKLTWSALKIRIGDRCVTTVFDKSLKIERHNLYVPTFPIVEWMVRNWWPLLHEVCLWESVPGLASHQKEWEWIKRHNFRAADSSLMLPSLSIFNDGRFLRATWQADQPQTVLNMPGEFIASGEEQLDRHETQSVLEVFIDQVLDRIDEPRSDRVHAVVENWDAIRNACREEMQFCIYAGRMGINPYSGDQVSDELAHFLEATLNGHSDAMFDDLTEVATATSVAQQWSWLSDVKAQLKLGSFYASLPLPSYDMPNPPQFGYHLARHVRSFSPLKSQSPIESVEKMIQKVLRIKLRPEYRGQIPAEGVRAVVGQSLIDGAMVIVAPKPPQKHSQRFLEARGFYHMLTTACSGPRLVTNSHSWNQKASRAFAAELLAPQELLVQAVNSSHVDSNIIDRLSEEFDVSRFVIEKQLENAGVSITPE